MKQFRYRLVHEDSGGIDLKLAAEAVEYLNSIGISMALHPEEIMHESMDLVLNAPPMITRNHRFDGTMPEHIWKLMKKLGRDAGHEELITHIISLGYSARSISSGVSELRAIGFLEYISSNGRRDYRLTKEGRDTEEYPHKPTRSELAEAAFRQMNGVE